MAGNENTDFDSLEVDEKAPAQEFSEEAAATTSSGSGDVELTPDKMKPSNYIKNPEVGKFITLLVEKVVSNPIVKLKNNTTGEDFDVGLKDSKGNVKRTDIITADGSRYTINSWEVFFKLFGKDGALTKFGDQHKTFKGAKLKIVKNYPGNYANMDAKTIAKLTDRTLEDAAKYKAEIGNAMKEKRLYTVELI
jgi:hypothetical protein